MTYYFATRLDLLIVLINSIIIITSAALFLIGIILLLGDNNITETVTIKIKQAILLIAILLVAIFLRGLTPTTEEFLKIIGEEQCTTISS